MNKVIRIGLLIFWIDLPELYIAILPIGWREGCTYRSLLSVGYESASKTSKRWKVLSIDLFWFHLL